MNLDNLLVYRHLTDDQDVIQCMNYILGEKTISEEDFVAMMLSLSEKYDLHHNLFQGLLTHLLANHENIFTLSLERKKEIDYTLKKVVMHDFQFLYDLYHYDFREFNELYKDLR